MAWKGELRLALGVVFTTAILVTAGLFIASRPAPDHARAEQYAVYSAYIEGGLTGESHSLGDRGRTVLIAADSTMAAEANRFQQLRFLVGSVHNLSRRPTPPRLSLIFGLLVANLAPHKFDRRFRIPAEYALLDSAAITFQNFHNRFPRSYGYLTFSSIAFNSDLTEALFYAEHQCGLCGGGEFVLMRRTRSSWVVVERYSTWVS